MAVAPSGSRVILLKGYEPIVDTSTELLLEEDIVLNLSSQFSPLVSGEANKNLTAISGVLQTTGANVNLTGQFKEFGFQQWTSTAPLGFSFTVGLYMKSNAKVDVMDPAYALMKLPLPTDQGLRGVNLQKGLKAPGPSVGNILKNNTSDFITLRVGPIYISPVVIKKVEPSFGLYTDEIGNYTSCVLRIDVESVFTATTNMIEEFESYTF